MKLISISWTFLNQSNVPIAGKRVIVFRSGTKDPLTQYTANGTPMGRFGGTDASGKFSAYVPSGGSYDLAILEADGSTIDTASGVNAELSSDEKLRFLNIKKQLTADASYWLSNTGSDTADGTQTSPWATLEHAVALLNGYDFNGHTVTLQLLDGSYAEPASLILRQNGTLIIQGNQGTPTTCTIQITNGISQLGGLKVGNLVFKLMAAQDDYQAPVITYGGSFAFFGALKFDANGHQGGWALGMFGGQGSVTAYDEALTFAGTWKQLLHCEQNAYFDFEPATINVTGVTINGTAAIVANQGAVIFGGGSFTGSIIGKSFAATDASAIHWGNSITSIPSSVKGTIDGGSSYNGLSGVALGGDGAVTVANLPAASDYPYARRMVTDANATMTAGIGAVVAGSGSNKVPVYSDGTNWRIG